MGGGAGAGLTGHPQRLCGFTPNAHSASRCRPGRAGGGVPFGEEEEGHLCHLWFKDRCCLGPARGDEPAHSARRRGQPRLSALSAPCGGPANTCWFPLTPFWPRNFPSRAFPRVYRKDEALPRPKAGSLTHGAAGSSLTSPRRVPALGEASPSALNSCTDMSFTGDMMPPLKAISSRPLRTVAHPCFHVLKCRAFPSPRASLCPLAVTPPAARAAVTPSRKGCWELLCVSKSRRREGPRRSVPPGPLTRAGRVTGRWRIPYCDGCPKAELSSQGPRAAFRGPSLGVTCPDPCRSLGESFFF